MTDRSTGSITASLPWSGMRNGSMRTTRERVRFDELAELHRRRTPAQLEALLAERLAQLRADPPRGYPR